MTFGYTMLAVGALALLVMAVLNANRLIVNADVAPARNEQFINAASLAEGLFGEIRTKNYDENVREEAIPASYFTLPSELGTEAGESFTLPDRGTFQSRSRYDDIDDYNNYRREAVIGSTTGYLVSAEVYYVSESDDFAAKSVSRTFVKKIVITVVSPPPDVDSISFSTIQAY